LIAVTSPAPRAVWQDAVAADPMALADHTPAWADAVVGGGRWADASRSYLLDDGSHVVLPLFRHRRALGWLASPPFGWGFGGLTGPRAQEPQVVAAVLDDLAGLSMLRLRLRPNPLAGAAWGAIRPRRTVHLPSRAHVLDLRGGPAAVLAAMKKETRRHIRRVEALDLDIEVGSGTGLLAEYQHLRALSVRRWAEQTREPLWLAHQREKVLEPPARTGALAAAMPELFRVRVARIDGHPVAANVVVLGRNAHATRSAMDRDRLGGLGVMPYLDWLAIQEAHAAGCDWFHLGETGGSTALAAYKEALGAVAYDYPEIRFEAVPLTPADKAARRVVRRSLGMVRG
jgi:hypothetical protein